MQEEKSYVQVKDPTTKMTLLINGPSCQTPASNCRIRPTSSIVERKKERKNGQSCQTPASNCRIRPTSLIVKRKKERKTLFLTVSHHLSVPFLSNFIYI